MAKPGERRSGRLAGKRDVEDVRKALTEAAATGSGLDDPMLVPHLELLDLKEVLTEGVRDQDLYGDILETICGATDDSQPVEQYDGTLGVTVELVNAHQRPVAQVQWNNNLASIYTNPGDVAGVRWGTGTMISRDLFLTAGHLFDQTGGGWDRPRQNGTSNVISPQEIATNMHLNFDYQVDASGALRPEQSFAIVSLLEYRLGGIDFAICRIAGNPGETFGWGQVATEDAAVNDMLCVIGHPAGVPKRIEAGPLLDFDGNRVRYNDIDTLGGNSGSAILRASTGRIVGVHTNGGCNPQGTGANFGMRVTSIRAQSPTLRSLGTTVATGVVADVLGGVVTLATLDKRLIDDIRTAPRLDLLRTSPIRDKLPARDLRTTPANDVLGGINKRIDDVKAAGLDIRPDLDPGRVVVNPQQSARPFVLSTPHHAEVSGAGVPGGTAEEYEAVITELGAAIAQQQAALEELAAQYDAVVAEYQQLLG